VCFVVVAVAAVVVAAVVMVVVMLNSSSGGGEHFYHPIIPRKPVHKLTFPNQSSPSNYLSQQQQSLNTLSTRIHQQLLNQHPLNTLSTFHFFYNPERSWMMVMVPQLPSGVVVEAKGKGLVDLTLMMKTLMVVNMVVQEEVKKAT